MKVFRLYIKLYFRQISAGRNQQHCHFPCFLSLSYIQRSGEPKGGGHGPREPALGGGGAFLLVDFFFLGPNGFVFTKAKGGRTPSPEGASRVGLYVAGGGGGGANSGGGGADASIVPRALETLGTPLIQRQTRVTYTCHSDSQT